METIKIRTFGETVYFLDAEGFQKGKVKRTLVVSDKKGPVEIKYYVVADSDTSEYGGREKKGNQLFDSRKEMIDHYANQ